MSDSKTLRVIDFHVHIGLKENWHEWVQAYQMAAQSEFYEHYEKMVNPDQFALYLEAHHIDKAVILPEISPITTGIVTNEYVLEFCKNHDIFLPFCTVNPSLSKQPDREFKKYIQMGARGLKLYPSYNHFFPNERRMYALYEIAQDSQVPVLVHTGSSVFKGSKLKYADPLTLDDVAADFPGLDILMAHGGRGLWYQEAFFLSRLHPRLYLEISGLPPKNLLKYFPDLEKNVDKVVYGSDWPGIKTISSNIEAIRGLPLAEDAVEKILYKNAARILKL
jgi:predicted TIM-barrel fold metal-dependent hydrolase